MYCTYTACRLADNGRHYRNFAFADERFFLLQSLITSILPYVLFTVALNYVEAGKVAILASSEPVAALFFGIVFYNEIPTVLSFCGLVLVLVALGLLSVPFKRKNDMPVYI